MLVRALRDVDNATLVVVGDGSERERLRALARELGIEGRIVWQGWTEDARSYLPSFDLLVLPSRFEGFPLVVLEAQLAETAVVATDVGSVAEAVLDGETGLLVPPDDAEALTVAIRRLLDDADLRRRLRDCVGAGSCSSASPPSTWRAHSGSCTTRSCDDQPPCGCTTPVCRSTIRLG